MSNPLARFNRSLISGDVIQKQHEMRSDELHFAKNNKMLTRGKSLTRLLLDSLLATPVYSNILSSRATLGTGTCSKEFPCDTGCCNKEGSCGFGKDFRGDDVRISDYDFKAECPNATCPLNVCCSEFGYAVPSI